MQPPGPPGPLPGDFSAQLPSLRTPCAGRAGAEAAAALQVCACQLSCSKKCIPSSKGFSAAADSEEQASTQGSGRRFKAGCVGSSRAPPAQGSPAAAALAEEAACCLLPGTLGWVWDFGTVAAGCRCLYCRGTFYSPSRGRCWQRFPSFELHPSPALGGDWLQPLLPVPLGCAAWLPSLHSSSSSLPPKAPGLGRAAAFSCGGQELSCLQLAAALEHSQLPLTRGSAEAQAPAVAARDAAPSCGVTWIFQPCPKPLLTAGLAPTPGERGTARRCPPACPRQLPSLLSPAPPEGAQPAVPVLLTPRGS